MDFGQDKMRATVDLYRRMENTGNWNFVLVSLVFVDVKQSRGSLTLFQLLFTGYAMIYI